MRLLLMEVDLVATAEVTEEVMEIHLDQEANPPGGRSYPGASTVPLGFRGPVDAARGGLLLDSLATSDSSVSFSFTLGRLGGFLFTWSDFSISFLARHAHLKWSLHPDGIGNDC